MERERFFNMVPLEMPDTVALSHWMWVDGCWLPSSDNVSLMVRPSFTFMNIAPNSDSTADDATDF